MATMLVKTLKNLLLWNQKSDDLGSWYVASDAPPNDDTGLTLTYLMARSNVVPYMLLYGKKLKQWIFRNYCSLMIYDIKVYSYSVK